MQPLDLYAIFRVYDVRTVRRLIELMSDKYCGAKTHEIETLRGLTDHLLKIGVTRKQLNGYFFSYTIPRIGKEFDVLRLSPDAVLNIELKYVNVGEKEIHQQLLRNEYYLRHLGKKVYLFTYVLSEDSFYTIDDDGRLSICDGSPVVEAIKDTDAFLSDTPDRSFDPEDYIFSPASDPKRFLEGRYFLTQHQERIKKELLEGFENDRQTEFFACISGGGGTGKTLLMYDIALEASRSGKACLLTAEKKDTALWDSYRSEEKFDIISAESFLTCDDTEKYRFIFIDNIHRISNDMVDRLFDSIKENRQICVLSTESPRMLRHTAKTSALCDRIKKMVGNAHYELTDRIRTDSNIAYFINALLDKGFPLSNTTHRINYQNTFLLYANNKIEAEELLSVYRGKGYNCIDPTEAKGKERYTGDKRIIVLNKTFGYNDDGLLSVRQSSRDDDIMSRLVFNALHGIGASLGILVLGNPKLFKNILNIYSE